MTTLVRNKPLDTNFLEGFWNRGDLEDMMSRQSKGAVPAVNVREDENMYEIELGAPGFGREDFDISVHDDHLDVKGFRKEEKSEKEQYYSHREFNTVSFERNFRLPSNVREKSITANYNNGMLYIQLPKTNTESNLKHIKIA